MTPRLRFPVFPFLLAALLAALLSACAGAPPPVAPAAATSTTAAAAPATAPAPAITPAHRDLYAGIGLYQAGDYAGAIRQLTASSEIARADKGTQLEAMKYAAFSYCVTAHQALCRQQFDKALKLDPAFDLAPGEKGHPLWGPVFDKAKRAARQ
jgi:hypothetical protein